MRISAGAFKGKKLIVPKGDSVRPTTDKVRQAIFNALNSRGAVAGASALDLFCGTGSLGLEALSRGAAYCTFVDSSQISLKACRENINACGAKPQADIIYKNVLKLPFQTAYKASLVLLDPPYRENLVFPTLDHLKKQGWIAEDAIIVVDCEKENDNQLPDGFSLADVKTYGDVKVLLAVYSRPA